MWVSEKEKLAAKEYDVYEYLRIADPAELVKICKGEYCLRSHDSFKISHKDGKWLWYWYSRGIGGRSAVDYLIKVKDYPFVDAIKEVNRAMKGMNPSFFVAEKEKKVFRLPPGSRKNDQVIGYLCFRGIDKSLIEDLIAEKMIYQNRKHQSVVFVGFDDQGKPAHASYRATGTSNVKGDFGGSNKALASDIALLKDMDYDIVTIKSSPNKYFWGNRNFEIPELKLLIDAVSSSRFITKKKSKELIRKITALASETQSSELDRHIVATGRAKTDNTQIYYFVDTISDASSQKKKIKFKYMEYNGKKEKVFLHDGEVYTLSPYVLYWNEDYYYVVGYSDKHELVSAFRVDRLHRPTVIDELAVKKPKGFNVSDYANKIFKMYDGEETIVELECQNELMKYIIDRYGMDVDTEACTEDTFIARVPVTLSPTFFGWMFQFAGKMKIRGPETVVEEYKTMLMLASKC